MDQRADDFLRVMHVHLAAEGLQVEFLLRLVGERIHQAQYSADAWQQCAPMRVREGMATDERAIWNARYAEKSHASMVPDPFLVKAFENYVSPITAATSGQERSALDLAGGVGRHAIWLAKRDWQVTLLDISDEALSIAKQNAEAAGTAIDLRAQSA